MIRGILEIAFQETYFLLASLSYISFFFYTSYNGLITKNKKKNSKESFLFRCILIK